MRAVHRIGVIKKRAIQDFRRTAAPVDLPSGVGRYT